MGNVRLTFEKSCSIIENAYGKENVVQIRKPDGKPFFVVDLAIGDSVCLYRDDIIRMM